MKVILAKTCGFCAGVKRAIITANKVLQTRKDKKIYALGPIIHNNDVMKRLQSQGLITVETIDEIENNNIVIIRAHGIAPEQYEKAKEKQLEIIDTTCIDVKKIHKIVLDYVQKDYYIVIVGDKSHPEVIGIKGWAQDNASVIFEQTDLDLLPSKDKVCVVAQTTISVSKWEKIIDALKNKYNEIIIENTICNTTSLRQTEAVSIAKVVDAMIIIGGKHSSNTQKLYEICNKQCNNTYIVENVSELNINNFKKIKTVGITAGASTPEYIIEEVYDFMSNINNSEEIDFAKALEATFVSIQQGSIIKGRVLGFSNNAILVDLGYKADGVLPYTEYSDDMDADPSKELSVGDEIEVYVVKINDGEGNVVLSKKRIEAMTGWDTLKEAMESKTVITGKVSQAVNGGVIANKSGLSVFIPASQLGQRVENLHTLVGKELNFRIIEVDKFKKRLIGSAKVLMQEQRQAALNNFWETAEEGKVYTGTVKRLTDFGAFVEVNGVEGLVHISELSWKRIKHPSEVLKVGDTIEVYVLKLDREKNKISLGFRREIDNPWANVTSKYQVGNTVTGKVLRMVPFGAFVEIEPAVDALVHISQISDKRITKPSDVLEVGQEIKAKVLKVDAENKQFEVSIKEYCPINEKGQVQVEQESLPTEHKEELNATVGDNINE